MDKSQYISKGAMTHPTLMRSCDSLQQVYGTDSLGLNLRMFTVHSLRHSHVMPYVVDRQVALPIVQKRVGHRSLKTTSVYLSPSTEKIGMAYRAARERADTNRDGDTVRHQPSMSTTRHLRHFIK